MCLGKRPLLLIFFFNLFLLLAYSVALATKIVQVHKVDNPPVIDGILDDPVWQEASIFTDFKTLRPNFGSPPSEKTEVYIIYDSRNIYLGFRCFDNEAEKIRVTEAERDDLHNNDWIALCLDTYNDELSGYFFGVNPLGIQMDGTINSTATPNMAFNMTWSSSGRLTEDGYSGEITIPFKNLPFPSKKHTIMSFKVARFICRKNEQVDFPEFLPDRGSPLAQFQKIELSGIEQSQVQGPPFATTVQDRYQRKKRMSSQFDVNTLEGRLRAWGEPDVIDYLLFPFHELKNEKEVFHFKKNLKEELVSSIFQSFEYNEGKKIEDFESFLMKTETSAFIIVLNDKIIFEKYLNGYQRDSMVTSFSVAKSFLSTLVGIAIDEGLIEDVNDPITRYIPELKERNPRFSSVTIKDLLLMSSGFKFRDGPPDWDNGTIYFHPDLREIALERTKIEHEPGEYFLYNNYNPLLIGLILERATRKTVSEYLQEKLWEPLGMEFPGSWSTDSEKSGFEKMVCGINARAIDFAKFGRLFIKKGYWGKKKIISSEWIEEATQPEKKKKGYYPEGSFFGSEGGYYKYYWWGRKRESGKNDFFAEGYRGQFIYISPQKDLIIVRNGIESGISSTNWNRLFYEFSNKIEELQIDK